MRVDIDLNDSSILKSDDLLNLVIMDYKKLKNKINKVQLSITDRELYKTLRLYEIPDMDGVDIDYLEDGDNSNETEKFYVNFIAMVLEARKRNLPLNYDKLLHNLNYIWANYY